MIKQIQLGLKGYSGVFQFMKKHKLLHYFIYPTVMNLVFFIVSANYIPNLSEIFINYINDLWAIDTWVFWGSEFVISTVQLLLNIIIYVFLFIVFTVLGGYIILILLSPVLAFLSEKVDQILTQKEYPFSGIQFIKDIFRGIYISLRNFLMEMLFIVLLFFFSFIPIVGFLSTPLLFLISCYYYGASFMDYSFERERISAKKSMQYCRNNKGIAIGNGIPFALTMMIPVIGVNIAAFTAIASTVSATLTLKSLEKK